MVVNTIKIIYIGFGVLMQSSHCAHSVYILFSKISGVQLGSPVVDLSAEGQP